MGSGVKFKWGTNDCAHHMARAVRAKHPNHPILSYLDQYENKASALRLLREIGGLSSCLSLHFEEINPLSAQDGDIGVIDINGVMAGCVIQNGRATGLALQGEFVLPVSRLTKAYRV